MAAWQWPGPPAARPPTARSPAGRPPVRTLAGRPARAGARTDAGTCDLKQVRGRPPSWASGRGEAARPVGVAPTGPGSLAGGWGGHGEGGAGPGDWREAGEGAGGGAGEDPERGERETGMNGSEVGIGLGCEEGRCSSGQADAVRVADSRPPALESDPRSDRHATRKIGPQISDWDHRPSHRSRGLRSHAGKVSRSNKPGGRLGRVSESFAAALRLGGCRPVAAGRTECGRRPHRVWPPAAPDGEC